MYISRLRVNHKKNPLGFNLAKIHLSWEVKDVCGKWAVETRIIVSESSNMEKLVYDSGVQENYHENQMLVSFDLKPRTRYYWQVEVKDDKGDCAKSNPAWKRENCRKAGPQNGLEQKKMKRECLFYIKSLN